MPGIQTASEIAIVLERLEGEQIAALQVLGINSLKSHSPVPDDLIAELVTGSAVHERTFTIKTLNFEIRIDLQRIGRLAWLEEAVPHAAAAATPRPTVRIALASGAGLDLTESAKTKRITVTLSAR